MEDYQNKLFPYAYNILGSSDDAKDAVQDVLANFVSSQKKDIENIIGYLIKGVINQSINIKNRKKKITSDKIWLPEPVATENADSDLKRQEVISYSMLVLLEKLNARERAVFILKEAFDYSHKDISATLDCTVENARKLLSRAKSKLAGQKKTYDLFSPVNVPKSYMENYIDTIKSGDTAALEKLLSKDISIAADGGDEVKVIRALTVGKKAASNLLFFVYEKFHKSQAMKLSKVNRQPAILFYEDGKLVNCQVFELGEDNKKIRQIFTVLDPLKLKTLA